MAAKRVSHVVKRPGRKHDLSPISIPVAEDLVSQPGIPTNQADIDYYSRRYPLESNAVAFTADSEWGVGVRNPEDRTAIQDLYRLVKPIIDAARDEGGMKPTHESVPRKDVTQEIKHKARQLGFGEVGITRYDRRYTFRSKKKWARYEHAVCLALEQDFVKTQTIPGTYAEDAAYKCYRTMSQLGLILVDYIRSLGYHAQLHSPIDYSAPYIPMFVSAGLGQLGANGQLLSPHFGSRARLMLVTTDALVTYDEPVDYGIHSFCQVCQVCVNRCPGRALMRDKVWWRGVEKNKLVYERCRPIMSRYSACGVCVKVCPIQKYGAKAVMEHYVETGQVLGKGTHALEGYRLGGKGYFGPGELPHFDSEFFHMPHGRSEDVLFEKFKEKLKNATIPDTAEGDQELREFKRKVEAILNRPEDEGMLIVPEQV